MAQAVANEALRLDPEMANAKKLVDYIEAKEEVLKRATSVNISGQASSSPTGALPAGHPAPAASTAH